jgi:spore coat polysaccharide biosynthesis protein SpsF (cytidylyltransferase family)
MLQYIIDNVNKSMLIDKLVVAIPKGQDIPFENAEKFEGSELDVLDRYYQCAKEYDADIIIRITADCPLINGQLIDTLVREFEKNAFPYLMLAPIDGLDAEIFNFEMLEDAWMNAETDYDKEHVTPYMKRATKLSVDTPEELEKVKKWIGGHGQKKSSH